MNRLVEQLGAGPFVLVENVPLENVLSRGEPAELVHNSAFGCCGRGVIELMEIISSTPSGSSSAFQLRGRESTTSPTSCPGGGRARGRKIVDERGLRQYLSAELGETHNTFHDGSESLGHDIEIHDDVPGLRDFFEMVSGSAEGWDGSEPLRPVTS